MKIILAIFILGIIIIIHEMGHFLLAKKNGITVTEFSVGMGPRIASFVHKDTRYSLKLFPIGGSCMMLGEDETLDDTGAFNNKGVWARFSVIFAGAFFNFVLAFILSLILLSNVGIDIPYVTEIATGSTAEEAGIVTGDRITKIDGEKINLSRELEFYFMYNISEKPVEISYLHEGKEATTTIVPEMIDTYMLGCTFSPTGATAEMLSISEGYPLADAGLMIGDVITSINGTTITTAETLTQYLSVNPLTADDIALTYRRGDQDVSIKVTPKLAGSAYSLGFEYNYYYDKISTLNVIKYSFCELKYNIVSTIKGLGYLITGKVAVSEVSGPVGIVNYVGDIVDVSADYGIKATVLSLIQFCILLSANLGVMNLLPLPALDGGRLVFILIEAIRRKPVPKEKEAIVHLVGMALLMLFMVFIMYNDISKLFI